MTRWYENDGNKPTLEDVEIEVVFNNGETVRLNSSLSAIWKVGKLSYHISKWRYLFDDIGEKSLKPDSVDTVGVNPKEAYGKAKLPLNLWPGLASGYGALGLANGAGKYGAGNYKATPVLASIYIAAAQRHLEAWKEGQECDPADGVPNLGGVLANIAILLESRAVGTLVDDRQIGGGYLKELDNMHAIAASLQELHKDKNPRHYTIADSPCE